MPQLAQELPFQMPPVFRGALEQALRQEITVERPALDDEQWPGPRDAVIQIGPLSPPRLHNWQGCQSGLASCQPAQVSAFFGGELRDHR